MSWKVCKNVKLLALCKTERQARALRRRCEEKNAENMKKKLNAVTFKCKDIVSIYNIGWRRQRARIARKREIWDRRSITEKSGKTKRGNNKKIYEQE